MSNSRTFPVVTPEILIRMKELGRAEHNIVYDPPDGPVGTATASLLAGRGEQLWGIDSSRDMLALARARLERTHLKHAQVRQADIYALPFADGSADLVTIHQVLHYLDDGARAIREAARVLRPQGRLLVVDFAPHDLEFLREEHAHRRLGFSPETVTQWMTAAGLDLVMHRSLTPEPGSERKIAVSLWLGLDQRAAKSTLREVA